MDSVIEYKPLDVLIHLEERSHLIAKRKIVFYISVSIQILFNNPLDGLRIAHEKYLYKLEINF